MKVSIPWLKKLVDLKIDISKVLKVLPLKTIAIKDVGKDYFELDMKGYNRTDLLSIRGVANEVAAITDSELKFEELDSSNYIWTNKQLPSTPIKIEDEELNQLQIVAKIEGLKMESSPKEWDDTLKECGMRSVNNIADVTNLVMLEYGQPLHAFDEATVKNDVINTRRANDGEEITTLDGKLRKLTPEDIVLADEEKALDVAGVMGGKDTEIKDSTTAILLSASLFNPSMIRKTANRLKLGSEASKRFYHGLTKRRLFQTLNAAIKMYEDLGGKLTSINIVGQDEDLPKTLILTQKKINSLIGIDIPKEQIEQFLKKLGFQLQSNGSGWEVTIPYWRLDIEIEEDLVEEVARMYGYEKIPPKEIEGDTPEKIDQTLPNFIYNLKVKLKDLGLTEVQTYSFYSSAVLALLKSPKFDINDLLKVANPISSETEYLRMDLWPNLVEVIGKNIKKGYKDIAIFEIGKIHFRNGEGKPAEKYTLSIALMNGSDNPLEELSVILNEVKNIIDTLRPAQGDISINPAKKTSTLFHPKRILDVKTNDKRIGGAGEIHLRLLNKLGIEKRVAAAEINIEVLV